MNVTDREPSGNAPSHGIGVKKNRSIPQNYLGRDEIFEMRLTFSVDDLVEKIIAT